MDEEKQKSNKEQKKQKGSRKQYHPAACAALELELRENKVNTA